MERTYKVGQNVIYVDTVGKKRKALVTIWWGKNEDGTNVPHYSMPGEPGCNVVFLSDDVEKRDSYGRQIERSTSLVHRSNQPANGNYWCWEDEV